jgi:hypothetical protein
LASAGRDVIDQGICCCWLIAAYSSLSVSLSLCLPPSPLHINAGLSVDCCCLYGAHRSGPTAVGGWWCGREPDHLRHRRDSIVRVLLAVCARVCVHEALVGNGRRRRGGGGGGQPHALGCSLSHRAFCCLTMHSATQPHHPFCRCRFGAAHRGQVDTVRVLLAQEGVDVNRSRTDDGTSPLCIACNFGCGASPFADVAYSCPLKSILEGCVILNWRLPCTCTTVWSGSGLVSGSGSGLVSVSGSGLNL